MGEMAKKAETAEQMLNRKLIQAEEIRLRVAKEEEIQECAAVQLFRFNEARQGMEDTSGILFRLLNKDWFGAEKDKYRIRMEAAASAARQCLPDAERKAANRLTAFVKAIKGSSQ